MGLMLTIQFDGLSWLVLRLSLSLGNTHRDRCSQVRNVRGHIRSQADNGILHHILHNFQVPPEKFE